MSKATREALNLEAVSKMADLWMKEKRKDRLLEKGSDAVLDRDYKGPLPTPRKLLKAQLLHLARIQKERVAFGNKIIAFKKAELPVLALALNYSMLKAYEGRLKDILRRMAQAHPMWDKFLKNVKGFGPLMSAYLFGVVDIARMTSPKRLLGITGYRTRDGQIEKRRKGQKLDYDPILKYAMFLAGDFMVRAKSSYKVVYDEAKVMYREKYPEPIPTIAKDGSTYYRYSKSHIHLMARRKMMNRFFIDLYVAWRTEEGLPLSETWEEVVKKDAAL